MRYLPSKQKRMFLCKYPTATIKQLEGYQASVLFGWVLAVVM